MPRPQMDVFFAADATAGSTVMTATASLQVNADFVTGSTCVTDGGLRQNLGQGA